MDGWSARVACAFASLALAAQRALLEILLARGQVLALAQRQLM